MKVGERKREQKEKEESAEIFGLKQHKSRALTFQFPGRL